MFGNDSPNALMQQMQAQTNASLQYLSQLGQGCMSGQQGMQNTQPTAPTNPNDRLIVLLTEV
jgi:hypothetical protein